MTTLQRLRDIPEIAALERRALLEPALRADTAGDYDDQVNDASFKLFGISKQSMIMMDDDDKPDGYDFDIVLDPGETLAAWFEKAGWDVTDGRGHELYVLPHFYRQLAASIFAGKAPSTTPDPETWGAALEREARKHRRRG